MIAGNTFSCRFLQAGQAKSLYSSNSIGAAGSPMVFPLSTSGPAARQGSSAAKASARIFILVIVRLLAEQQIHHALEEAVIGPTGPRGLLALARHHQGRRTVHVHGNALFQITLYFGGDRRVFHQCLHLLLLRRVECRGHGFPNLAAHCPRGLRQEQGGGDLLVLTHPRRRGGVQRSRLGMVFSWSSLQGGQVKSLYRAMRSGAAGFPTVLPPGPAARQGSITANARANIFILLCYTRRRSPPPVPCNSIALHPK